MDTANTQLTSSQGRLTVIAGLNASGKTQLAERMRRQMKSDSVRYVAFCDTYGTATDRSYYLQQRWNQHDIEELTPRVGQALERSFQLSGSDTPERRTEQERLYELMGMKPLLDKYVISLSSGELRKMQMVKTLMARPSTLILDNPFIGLDAEARTMFSQQLQLLKQQGMQIYLLVARPNEIPPFADEMKWTTSEEKFLEHLENPEHLNYLEKSGQLYHLESLDNPALPHEVIRLTNVSICYGDRIILDRLNWSVQEGEHWALSGPNGSGKSTLLSLVCADNPQGYACDIALFGHQRGTGESIWDIKRRIGYVSPEMHRSYLRNMPSINIVASGLKDTVGLYVKPSESEREQCLRWMQTFSIDHLAQRSFMQLSSGEQRLILVCRAFVKNPDLLILDEPMHGLDLHRQRQVKDIIEHYCRQSRKTLIMVTHYEEELPACIDHRLHLRNLLL